MTDSPPSPAIGHDPDRHRFHVRMDGHEAELLYRLEDGAMVIDHTGVPLAIGGRGVAGHLVREAFEHAKAQGWRVVPACSYAAVWVARHPEYATQVAG
ncbi:GNAT family N-acetyltransferase [Pseudoxanthomonas broegbernensis]|uniref:GNAT family N-acetyltransferase n=1 Tax=Pseudoxanthomonas broegbernensis TaxID=83619 RepID=A0A7V8GPW7_9GAMM|nr:GNAT family N-acetyltransferase [Pseudoxanthomonas broegbernensis]KAF1687943.1 GNAT family N-acetyltransferase [Pseudoxanthomonas broegbernensis]MBB6064951.1 hypothetical protein [Pseudoxanthomonas broegbernensis]